MAACREETINGFNEQVQKLRGQTRDDGTTDSTFVTLVLFNHEVRFVRFAVPLGTLVEITKEQYVPHGTTAMLDAVGSTLSRFEQEVSEDEDTRYLVIVISDGEENDSHDYTYERIAEIIQKRQAIGRWTFSYMGANQDLSDVSKRLSIPEGNMVAYTSSPEGTAAGFTSLSRSMVAFMSRRNRGAGTSEEFFSDQEEIESSTDDDGSEPKGGRFLH